MVDKENSNGDDYFECNSSSRRYYAYTNISCTNTFIWFREQYTLHSCDSECVYVCGWRWATTISIFYYNMVAKYRPCLVRCPVLCWERKIFFASRCMKNRRSPVKSRVKTRHFMAVQNCRRFSSNVVQATWWLWHDHATSPISALRVRATGTRERENDFQIVEIGGKGQQSIC